MTAISTAIGLGRRSRVSGYNINKLFLNNDTPNLPQKIAIFAQANTANQAGLTVIKREITSAREAGEEYGFGSPIHQIMRILRPSSGGGVGGVPTIVFPQLEAAGASASTVVLTVTGNATANATHNVVVSGRNSIDFQGYNYSVVTGDTPTIIAGKIVDAVNSVLGSPFMAANTAGVITFTTKWKGATSTESNAVINTGSNTAGVTYANTSVTAGSGEATLADSFSQIGSEWITIAINSYGEAALADFEQFNGKPTEGNPTGRFVGEVFMPLVSLFGSTEDDRTVLAAITNDADRIEEQTNVLCPAPNSAAHSWEAAANVCAIYAPIAQNTPHLDANNRSYPDMPVPENGIIGDMSEYNNRDLLVKNGCSTVILDKGAYKIQDFVTTYHPSGEIPLQYAYVRNLTIDFNIAFGYRILEEREVKDHVIVADLQVTDAPRAIKRSEWRGILFEYFDDLAERALINDPAFSKTSLLVQVPGTNPDRFESNFSYRRTGVARIQSTTVNAGF